MDIVRDVAEKRLLSFGDLSAVINTGMSKIETDASAAGR